MPFCSNCGTSLEDSTLFCPNCGTKQVAAAPANYAPAAPQQPAYAQPVSERAPEAVKPVSVKAKVFGGVGFGVSTFGLVFSIICFFLSVAAADASYYERVELATLSLVYSLMFIVTGILGMIFSGKARDDGNTSALTMMGKIFGLIATIVFGIALFISFIALID